MEDIFRYQELYKGKILATVIVKGQKERRPDQKTILITKVTETIMDPIFEMSSEKVKLFNRESEALRRIRAEYWLIMLIKK